MPTALEYIHALAEETTEFGLGTTTAAGTTTSFTDAKLINSNLSSTELANMAVLFESGAVAGQVGSLKTLTRTTGSVSTATTATTAIASGVAYSLYRLFPPLRQDVVPGILEIVNQSLPRVWVPRSATLSGTTDLKHYSVATIPGLTDPRRIIEIQYPLTAADDVPRVLPRQSWTYVADGETRQLRVPGAPFRTGETFVVRYYAPGNARLKLNASLRAVLTATAVTSVTVALGGYYTAVPTIAPSSGIATFTAVMAATPGPITSVTVGTGGTYVAGAPPALVVTRNASDTGWADQTSQRAGLASLSDEALSDVADVLTMGKARMYEMLSKLQQPAADVAEWLAQAQPNIAAARALQRAGLPRDESTGVIGGRHAAFATSRRGCR